jgi:mono/diheme cytochrome c family protein
MILRSIFTLSFFLIGCQPKLSRQPRVDAYTAAGSRPLPAYTVSQETENHTQPPVTRELLQHGRHEFETYCAVCHGLAGDGDGIAVDRGLPPPPSYHTDSARILAVSDIAAIIEDGRGRMFAMAGRIPYRDRWAIANYVHALQLSRHFPERERAHK